jgi:hypothetical protein
MQPPDLIALVLAWVTGNWATLAILGTLALSFWRLGRVIDRWEKDSQTVAKLVRLHSLIHPNHAGVLYNSELSAKDIDEDAVDKCNRRGS